MKQTEIIENVREMGEANYQACRELMGDSVSLAQDMDQLYELLSKIILRTAVTFGDDLFAAAHFLSACRSQLSMGVLTCLRGHLYDSFFFTRRAIELCAFAARVKKHDHLARVWLNSADDEASYERYREKFKPGKLFPREHATLGVLFDRYDLFSKMVHPSLWWLAPHIEVKQTPTSRQIKFNYFTLKGEDPGELIRTFFWNIDTHFQILRVFEEVFGKAIAYDRPNWDLRRNAFEAKMSAHKNRWAPLIRWVEPHANAD